MKAVLISGRVWLVRRRPSFVPVLLAAGLVGVAMLLQGCVTNRRALALSDAAYSKGYVEAQAECFPRLVEKSKALQDVNAELQILRDKYEKCGGWIKRGAK